LLSATSIFQPEPGRKAIPHIEPFDEFVALRNVRVGPATPLIPLVAGGHQS
jgi:hypothetical protein